MLKNLKISVKTSILVTIVLIVGFFALWNMVDKKSTNLVQQGITNQMTDAVESRATIINNYVSSAEEYMVAFSLSDEVKNVLRTKGEPEALRKAQKYTVEYAKVKGVFEGLYIASPETYIYTHTSESVAGIRTRKDEELPEFQKQILVEGKLTNLGIMPSRGTGGMCISMYYPVFENGECLGFVGAAVFANNLMESITSLAIGGLPNVEYIFLNVETGEYLYNNDESLLCTVTEDKGCLEVLDKLRNDNAADTGILDYVDDSGDAQIMVYKNIPERNWCFALKDKESNVFSSLLDIKRTTLIVCVAIAVIIIILLFIVMMNIGRILDRVSKSISKLGNMDLTAARGLEKYTGKKDEIGTICTALTKTCANLNTYIGEIGKHLSMMAQGDFSNTTSMEFAGEFKKLNKSMDEIQSALQVSFSEIGTVTNELVIGSRSVADSASHLANAANESSEHINGIDNNIEEISTNVSLSASLAQRVSDESAQVFELVKESYSKMSELSKAMSDIAEATDAIHGISNSLEKISRQTNLLALNALVEAKRAGAAGDGFAVVANEIRALAEQSRDTAASSYSVIEEMVEKVNNGIKFGDETVEYLGQVVSQTKVIDESIREMADATKKENEEITVIKGRLHDIGKSVEIIAQMSEQSASASIELDGQTMVLNENISRYRV
ncbi:MAG: methyl-accepting chemotaxis protein [Lachnospiraceae bacterium]|nr:methyl-accepting chemotaxis protein [Lachnospiraceae bacterium]MBQ2320672.1 methyl-accepting chemotaxis protein [Lachnospiraceae bacterium]